MTNQVSVEAKFKVGDKVYLVERSEERSNRCWQVTEPLVIDKVHILPVPAGVYIYYMCVGKPWRAAEKALFTTKEEADAAAQLWNEAEKPPNRLDKPA